MTIVRKPRTIVLIGVSALLAVGVAGMSVKAQIKKNIFIIETINPSAPCMNGLYYPCWLTAKGATLENPSVNNAYYLNINAPLTLRNFKIENRFIDFSGSPLNTGFKAFYFNNGDLQLGREMHCNQNGAYAACYVSNYGPPPYPPGTLDNNTTYPNVEQALAEIEEVFPNGPEGVFCTVPPLIVCLPKPHPFATVAMISIPPAPPQETVSVREADGFSGGVRPQKDCIADYSGNIPPTDADVDTGLDIETGDIIAFTATGSIWDGYCFIGRNSPDGLASIPAVNGNYDYPLPSAHEEALIGQVGSLGNYFEIGSSLTLKYRGPAGRLFLRTNDNMPGNGSGAFDVNIQIQRQSLVRFYVYDNQENLTTAAALDREGFKSVPQMCMACHGGIYDTQSDEAYYSSFLPFDVFSFKYSQRPGLTLDDQQEQFRQLNQLVKNTNPNPSNVNRPIQNLIDALYNNDVDVPGTKAIVPQPPPSWQGHEALYRDFFARYCRTCHSASAGWDFFDFQTFNVSLIGAVVCDGEMPHAQVPYTALAGARIDPFEAADLAKVPCLTSAVPIKVGPPKPP